MIDFQCPGCRRAYRVADSFAGRSAHCKACGATLVVPGAAAVPTAAPAGASVRTRRLLADVAALRAALDGAGSIRLIRADGEPPETYEIEYRVRSLEPGADGQPQRRDLHRVRIQLPRDYPRLGPHCRMLTPIFHPNIDAASICVGDHWTAGERLLDLVTRIGEMLAYQAYNLKSPLNAQAAMWTDLHADQLPTDPRPLRPGE